MFLGKVGAWESIRNRIIKNIMFYEESTIGRDYPYSREAETYLIYAWGKNEEGELGLETTKNIK